jgi:hypothetical protein
MLYGHIAVGFAAKPLAPKVKLGYLIFAATAIDFLCGVFLLTGIEGVDAAGAIYIPWSHGLFMAGVWSLLGFALAFLASRDWRTGLIIGALVFSHWVLDFISHPMGMGQKLPPDLPLFFGGSRKVGLGLYNCLPAALVTEFGIFAAGIIVYLLRTRARDKVGRWAFAVLILFTFLLAVPGALPNLEFVPTLALILLLPLGNWVERHRILMPPRLSRRKTGAARERAGGHI